VTSNRHIQRSGSPHDSLTAGPVRTVTAARRERIPWLDFFRGAAVLVMIETHVVNTFLLASVRAESWFAVLNYVNGLVAPSFLFIAGFVQGMAPVVAGKPMQFGRRARRLLGIGLMGYALHFPWGELAQHRWDVALRVGTQVDVLQCLAVSLGLLLLVSWIAQKSGNARNLWLGTSALLIFFVGIAPAAAEWRDLPVPVLAWLNDSTGSWFPLFPWAGFVFVGAMAGAAGRQFQKTGEDATPALPSEPRSLLGTVGFPAIRPSTLSIAPIPFAIAAWMCRHAYSSRVSASSFLERTAWVFILGAICEWLGARRRFPRLVMFAGQHSLTLYVVHLVLITALCGMGVPMQDFAPAEVLAGIVGVGSVSLAVTWLIARLRTFRS
jgi:uncharacterized membrane protein